MTILSAEMAMFPGGPAASMTGAALQVQGIKAECLECPRSISFQEILWFYHVRFFLTYLSVFGIVGHREPDSICGLVSAYPNRTIKL